MDSVYDIVVTLVKKKRVIYEKENTKIMFTFFSSIYSI